MLEAPNTLKKRDSGKIDANNKLAVEYLHLQYPWYTRQQIKEVIKTAGPIYSHIEKELRLKHVGKVKIK